MVMATRVVSWFAAVAALMLGSNAAAQTTLTVPPVAEGPFPVACSNVEQDFSRLLPGESANLYWEGIPADGRGRYVTDLLRDPAGALLFAARIPDRRELFSDFAGQDVPYALLVCYPTDSSNPRAGYTLPGGGSLPRMQRGTEGPIWPESFAPARWPLLMYAHGLGGSPLADDYLSTATLLASHGYVVAAPFFADARFSRLRIEELSDRSSLLIRFDRVVAMQAVRPIAVSQAIDYLLSRPEWRDHLDTSRIAGFGASLGGETLLLNAGAKLTVSLGQSSAQVTYDPRIRAVVGYVPYFGPRQFPAFGASESGLDAVSVPFLGIAGTADTTAPIAMVEQGVNRMQGSRFVVALEGAVHGLNPAHVPDLLTWSTVFLDAFVNDSPASRARLATMTSVAGGANDSTRVDYVAPLPALGNERSVIEYYNAGLDHYFLTVHPFEMDLLDAGVRFPGWRRTGYAFKSYASGDSRGDPVCRFSGTPGLGPNSHFYSVFRYECDIVLQNPRWTFESWEFAAVQPIAQQCPADRVPVYRVYNQDKGGEANHRYTSSRSVIAQMQREGWHLEGMVFCGTP